MRVQIPPLALNTITNALISPPLYAAGLQEATMKYIMILFVMCAAAAAPLMAMYFLDTDGPRRETRKHKPGRYRSIKRGNQND